MNMRLRSYMVAHGILRYLEINSSKGLDHGHRAYYRTKQFKISKTTLTSQGEYIWNGTKVKRW